MSNRFFDPGLQYLDNAGEPLSGGLLYFYTTGTSTPATTYSDSSLSTENDNPVVLDSAGRAGDIFLEPDVTYKAVLKDSTGATTFWTKDPVVDPAANVTAAVQVYNGDPNGNVAGSAGSVGGSSASMVYDITNDILYICTTTGTTSTAVWTQVGTAAISGQEDIRTSDHTIVAADRARTQVANKASAITFNLTAVATIGAGFVVPVKNIGAGILTVDPDGSELIDGVSTLTLAQYDSAVLYCMGTAWRTLAHTRHGKSTAVDLSDGATPALDASLGNLFRLTAAGDRTIAVPSNPSDGQRIIIAHTASGGSRTLSLNTGAGGFRFGDDVPALTATASGDTDYIGAIYNGGDSKWDVVAYVKGYS